VEYGNCYGRQKGLSLGRDKKEDIENIPCHYLGRII
jgi:hypothetical protein